MHMISVKQIFLWAGWCVLHYNFSWSDNHFFFFLFWQFSVGQIHFDRCILAPCGAHKCFEFAILKKKKRKKKYCYQYKDFNHRCKGYTLGKTPVSLPITTGYSLPPTWDRPAKKKGSRQARSSHVARVAHAPPLSGLFFFFFFWLTCFLIAHATNTKTQMKKNEPSGLLFTSSLLAKSGLEVTPLCREATRCKHRYRARALSRWTST